MATERTKLVLGRGELFFNPFQSGTTIGRGEIYIGNTPEFTTSREVTSLPIFDSFDGQKIEREGVITRETHNARFTTDHIDMQNFSLWYGGDPIISIQNRTSDNIDQFKVYRGRYYQLGTSVARPMGVRAVEDVVVKRGSILINAIGNYDVDKTQGRIQILPNAVNVEDGDILSMTYERRDVTKTLTISRRKELLGSLRFVSRNPIGPAKNYFYPLVRMNPTGDIDHKANDWQRISFEVAAQRRDPSVEFVYIDEIQVIGQSVTEAGLDYGGITEEEFPLWEDELHLLVNVQIPSHNYS